MKFPRQSWNSFLILCITAATTTTVSIWTVSAFVPQHVLPNTFARRILSPNSSPFMNRHDNNIRNVADPLNMIFKNWFGGGGVYSSSIDYDNLDFPGPELAQAARNNQVLTTSLVEPHLHLATFAGGCFWGLELAYQRVPGVMYTAVGYTQGSELEPSYSQVCSGSTGHTEAVMVYYDPKECSYDTLLQVFFDRVNPTTVNGQGNDFGTQYRTGVYTHSPEQEAAAQARFQEEAKRNSRPIATELKAAKPFWPAEKYHQQYLEKGGRMGRPQSAAKGATDPIRCYG